MSRYSISEHIFIVRTTTADFLLKESLRLRVTDYKQQVPVCRQSIFKNIKTSTLQRVMQNFAIRLRHIIDTDGRHMEHAFNKFPCIVLCFRILIQFFESVVFKKLIFNISESPCITNYPVIILYNLLIIPCHLQKNLINLFLYKMHFNKRFY